MKSPFDDKRYTYMKRSNVHDLLSADNPTINWIFKRLAGFTIATEPEFCGGLKKSNYFLKIIEDLYFTPSLFHKQLHGKGTRWKPEIFASLQTN